MCVPEVPGFHDAVRENILKLLSITFQRIHKKVLGSYLSLQPAELDKLVRSCGLTINAVRAGFLAY